MWTWPKTHATAFTGRNNKWASMEMIPSKECLPVVFEMAAVEAPDTPKQLRFRSRFPIDPRHMRSNLWSIRLKTSAMASGFLSWVAIVFLRRWWCKIWTTFGLVIFWPHRSEKRIQVKVDHFPQRLRTQKKSVIETTSSTSDLLLPTCRTFWRMKSGVF